MLYLGKFVRKPRRLPLDHALCVVVLSHPKVIVQDQQIWTVASASQRGPDHSSLHWSLCRRHSAQLSILSILRDKAWSHSPGLSHCMYMLKHKGPK